jgi:hypothetical protein
MLEKHERNWRINEKNNNKQRGSRYMRLKFHSASRATQGSYARMFLGCCDMFAANVNLNIMELFHF